MLSSKFKVHGCKVPLSMCYVTCVSEDYMHMFFAFVFTCVVIKDSNTPNKSSMADNIITRNGMGGSKTRAQGSDVVHVLCICFPCIMCVVIKDSNTPNKNSMTENPITGNGIGGSKILRHTHWFHIEGTLKNFKIWIFCTYFYLSSEKDISPKEFSRNHFLVKLEPFWA